MYVLQSAEEDLASGFIIAALRACTAVPALLFWRDHGLSFCQSAFLKNQQHRTKGTAV